MIHYTSPLEERQDKNSTKSCLRFVYICTKLQSGYKAARHADRCPREEWDFLRKKRSFSADFSLQKACGVLSYIYCCPALSCRITGCVLSLHFTKPRPSLRVSKKLYFRKVKTNMIRKEDKTAVIEANRTHATDTGSPEVQVAILTARITELTEHLKVH